MLAGRAAAPFLLAVTITMAACGSSISPPPTATATAPSPSLTPVPGAPSPPAPTPPPTSRPEFGAIWDALPPSWPALPDQQPSEFGSDASAMFVVMGRPATLARQLGAALEASGWTVDVGSPLEDGSVVLEATGEPAGCRAEARFSANVPGSTEGSLLVYYGAACPFH